MSVYFAPSTWRQQHSGGSSVPRRDLTTRGAGAVTRRVLRQDLDRRAFAGDDTVDELGIQDPVRT
eukprot:CAMPEP_0174868398 /NCGR_PEP_ID=MMETSP1114-20130205/65917_1 /TAXON_ID=312471 /ORGANISM="Neobodo designis, Strain CCAP 1951/1" /LENGTH=64 /DNA_ID=CAMNT_0016103615 /DNA_START=576 /DNA_END=771 /DNA_ORIENTATION=-